MEIAIVGAGIVGSTLAIQLTREGHAVTLFERRTTYDQGVALTLHARGIQVLESIGIHLRPHNISGMTIEDFSGNRLAYLGQETANQIVTIRFNTLHRAIQSHFQSSIQLLSGTTVRAVSAHNNHMTVHTYDASHSFEAAIVAAGRKGRVLASYAPASKLINYRVARAIVPKNPENAYGERWGPGIRVGHLPIDENWDYTWLTLSQRGSRADQKSTFRNAELNKHAPALRTFHSVHTTKPPTRREIEAKAVPMIGDAFATTSPEGGLGITRGLVDAHHISSRLRDVTTTKAFIAATQEYMLLARRAHERSLLLTNILAESHSIDTSLFEAIRLGILRAMGDRGVEAAWKYLTRGIGTQ